MLLIVCRADAATGFGHLVRSRALADIAAAKGCKVILTGPSRSLATPADEHRFAEWIELPAGATGGRERTEMVEAIAAQRKIGHIILDDYSWNGEEQLRLRTSGFRLLQQYDASAPPDFAAHIAANASPAENAALHTGRLLSDDVRFLNGPAYAVLRPEFSAVERKPPRVGEVRRILVTFGGGDDRGGVDFVLKAMARASLGGARLVIMTSVGNPNLAAISAQTATPGAPAAELSISPAEPARLIASCDLAVMAGGTTVYEAAYFGLPMVLISIAGNQQGQCQGWQDLGAARYMGPLSKCDGGDLAEQVGALIANAGMRRSMGVQGQKNVDLHGGMRLLNALFEWN